MNKIGLYVYKIILADVKTHKDRDLSDGNVGTSLANLFDKFILENKTLKIDGSIARSWILDPRPVDGFIRDGWIRYGSFGYQSTIHDSNTREKKYDRLTSDIEEIPLYYHFWIPNKGPHGFAVFQSFGERSCVDLVRGAISSYFNNNASKHRLFFKKFMPQPEGELQNLTVKRLILIKKNFPKDQVEKVVGVLPSEVDVEISIQARRRGMLGTFSDLAGRLLNKGGAKAFLYEGVEFERAMAEVQIGKTRRKVGLFGYSNHTGVIDVTEDVEISEDGHPTIESISQEVRNLLVDFSFAYGKPV